MKTILVVLLFSVVVKAAENETHLSFLTNLPEDWQSFGDATFSRENLGVVSGVLVSTAALIGVDEDLYRESKNYYDQSRSSQIVHWQGVSIGDGYFQVAIAGVFGAVGYLAGNARAQRTFRQTVEVILSTGAVVQILKHYTGRESPFKKTEYGGRWDPLPEQKTYYTDVQKHDAMPTGHLATAYATFMVIEANYPEQAWIPWVGYPVCVWVAQGLVGTGLHWWSDYPIGLALGHYFAKHITARNGNTVNSNSNFNFFVLPHDSGTAVLTTRWEW